MRIEKQPAVYIMSDRKHGVPYIGVTSALWTRVSEHKSGTLAGFTSQHGLHRLVWYEHHHTMQSAIHREKQLKKWKRRWKLEMIDRFNPEWRDLHEEIDALRTLVPVGV
ncbi:GIY-YIG nuclease family protein [Aestuariivirga sp.]|uniref:GIY-YIG nuclease family protein n=1 Tax=Aestuariivirga sp. TaxID=2650926 RepID=UPI0039E569BF